MKSIRISPQKRNILAGLIRGKSVHSALDQLTFCRKRAAKQVYDLLVSAISNAENHHSLDMDRLIVAEAYVGKSLMMKRFHARGPVEALVLDNRLATSVLCCVKKR